MKTANADVIDADFVEVTPKSKRARAAAPAKHRRLTFAQVMGHAAREALEAPDGAVLATLATGAVAAVVVAAAPLVERGVQEVKRKRTRKRQRELVNKHARE